MCGDEGRLLTSSKDLLPRAALPLMGLARSLLTLLVVLPHPTLADGGGGTMVRGRREPVGESNERLGIRERLLDPPAPPKVVLVLVILVTLARRLCWCAIWVGCSPSPTSLSDGKSSRCSRA